MNNKRHNIIDDAWEMKPELLGGAVHTMRIGLAVNTVMEAMPIVIDDILKLAVEKPVVDYSNLQKDLPVLLHYQNDDAMVAILVVYDQVTGGVQCYPFNNLNEGGYWWLYEMGFDITKSNVLEIRAIHPILEEIEFEPTVGMMDHVEALATIVGSFLHRLQAGDINIVEEVVDNTKINKKRVKKGKEPLVNSWKIEHAK